MTCPNCTCLACGEERKRTEYVFRSGDYPANPAPGSMGIWPVKGWIPAIDPNQGRGQR